MPGSTFGKNFCLTTFGESHGAGLGAVVDGMPPGIPLSETDVQTALNRRKPGGSPYATPRKEPDTVEILSGVFEGKTTGTPVAMLIRNTNQRSGDYDSATYRPGHGDLTYDLKYGFRDYRGGGRASGRETAARVAGGALAAKFLAQLGVTVRAYTHSIADITVQTPDFSVENFLNMPDAAMYAKAAALVEAAIAEGDSLGGEIACTISNLPPGIGEPVFDKLEAVLAHAVMSIGGIKGIAFGAGFGFAKMKGSTANDSLYAEDACGTGCTGGIGSIDATGVSVKKRTNHAGGMYAGISDGSDINFIAAVKPTPSITKEQQTVNNRGENITISVRGRHDPLIVPRAVPVVEAMAALAAADLVLAAGRMDV